MSSLPVPQIVWPLSDRGLAPRLMDLATLPFVVGDQKYARQAFLGDVDSIDGLTPREGEIERELVQDNGKIYKRRLRDHYRQLQEQGGST